MFLSFLLITLSAFANPFPKGFDSRQVAEQLVAQKAAVDESRAVDPAAPRFDFYNKTSIVLAFPFQYFESIRQNGFLNQFQVSHSANMDRKHRLLVEDQFFGVKLPRSSSEESPVQYLRPKYAYLALDMRPDDPRLKLMSGRYGISIDTHYGNVYAKFKNEVKSRTTMTSGDSMVILGSKSGDVRSLHATQTSPVAAMFYFEAQVWGALTLQDVDYLLVNCNPGKIDISPEQIAAMKAAGVAVYKCIPRGLFGNTDRFFYNLDRGPRL